MSAIPTDQEIRIVADRFARRFDVDDPNFAEEMVTVLFGVLDTLQTLRRSDQTTEGHSRITLSIKSIYELMRDWSAK